MQVIFNQLYNKDSEGQKGTLKQLQTIIGRAKIPTKVKDNAVAVEDFVDIVLDAHVVCAAMAFFGMSNSESEPTANIDFENIRQSSSIVQWKALSTAVNHFLQTFIMHGCTSELASSIHTLSTQPPTKRGKKKNSEVVQQSCTSSSVDTSQEPQEDRIYNYACRFMGMALMARNFHDASREGDGLRTIRCWKFLMLYYKADNRVKYAVEAFHLLAQVNALLPPHMAHQLIWNRTCNIRGGEGKNIPLDLQVEHLNRIFKDDLNKFHRSINERSVARSSQAIGTMKGVLEKFDRQAGVKQPSGRHVEPSDRLDFSIILKALMLEKVFDKQPGRFHSSFKSISADPFASINANPEPFYKWLRHRMKAESMEQDLTLNLT